MTLHEPFLTNGVLKCANELSLQYFSLYPSLVPSSLLDVWTGLPVPVLPGLGEAGAGHTFGPAGPAGGAGHQGGARGPGAPQPHHWAFPCKTIKAEDKRVWGMMGKKYFIRLFFCSVTKNPSVLLCSSVLMWCGGTPAGLWTACSAFGPDSGWGRYLLAWWWEETHQHVPMVRRRRRVWRPDWRGLIGYKLRDKPLQVQPGFSPNSGQIFLF